MKDIINNINKDFESRIRLGIMSVLMVNDSIDFNSLKELLDVTDGNLASHIGVLEKKAYVSIFKQFVGKKPNTSYKITGVGRKSFIEHLNALEKLVKGG